MVNANRELHIPSHIHWPLQWLDNTFPDYHLLVVVFDALADICSGLRGLTGHCAGSPYLHPLFHLGPLPHHQLWLHCHLQGPSDFPGVILVGMQSPSFKLFCFREPLALPTIDHHPGVRNSWLVPPRAWMPGPPTALCPGWACWGEAAYPLPYPQHVYEHQMGNCFSWQYTLSPAYPSG